jgi:hypothetical protein
MPAPGLVSGAMQMKEQAEQMAAAQQAAAQQAAAAAQQASEQAAAAGGLAYEPIAGVSLQQFAEISKGLAAHGYDQAKGPEVAASKGVSAPDWQTALDGWNERIKSNPSVAQQFNRFYTGS